MKATGGPGPGHNIGNERAGNYSPLARPTYSTDSFERVLAGAERPASPPVKLPVAADPARASEEPPTLHAESRRSADRTSGWEPFDADEPTEEAPPEVAAQTAANATAAQFPTALPAGSPTGAAPTPRVDPNVQVDAATLAAKLDQMGIQVSVRGLATGAVPRAQPGPVSGLDRPSAATSAGASETAPGSPQPESAPTAEASAPDSPQGESSAERQSDTSQRDAPPDGSADSSQGENPAAVSFGGPANATPASFSAMTAEAVAAVDEAGAIPELGPVVLPDGITVRVADPEGAWEVDILRTGSDLSLLLRGSQAVTESVLRDETTLRNELAREGWHLSQLRIDSTDNRTPAVRASSETSTPMSSDHPGARREEAPPWQPPRTARPTPRTIGTPGPTILQQGRLDREI